MEYLLITLSTILMSGNFCLSKIYQKNMGSSQLEGFKFNALVGLFVFIIYFVLNGFKMHFTWYSFIMSALFNSFVVAYTIMGFKLLKYGSMALYTLFLMSGGMIVPYIWGIAFLGE